MLRVKLIRHLTNNALKCSRYCWHGYISVTRFGEIPPLWQQKLPSAILRVFIKSLAKCMLIFIPLGKFSLFWATKYWKYNLAIWSHWLLLPSVIRVVKKFYDIGPRSFTIRWAESRSSPSRLRSSSPPSWERRKNNFSQKKPDLSERISN